MENPAKKEVWRLAAEGNMESYAQLRQLHQNLVRSVLQRYIVGLSPSDLEDLEQEVWITVWKALPSFQGRSALTTWLTALTRNVASAWLRHKRSNDQTLLRFAADNGGDTQKEQAPDSLGVLGLDEVVDRLSAREHQVIALRYFNQLTDQEIASRLRLPLGTVKGRIRAGLTHLRDGLRNQMMMGLLSLLCDSLC